MNRLNYLKAVVESQISPMEVMMKTQEDENSFFHVDVRIGPKEMRKEKIAGALEIPLYELENKLNLIPKDKVVLVSTWEIGCSLAKQASIVLLENGYNVLEVAGGVASWKQLGLPMQEVQ